MKPSFALYRRFLTRYLANCRGQVALLGFMLLVHTVASVYAPQLLRRFIDGVVAGSTAEQLAAGRGPVPGGGGGTSDQPRSHRVFQRERGVERHQPAA